MPLYLTGVAMNAIGRLRLASTPADLRWIKKFAMTAYEKSESAQAVVIDLDELQHF